MFQSVAEVEVAMEVVVVMEVVEAGKSLAAVLVDGKAEKRDLFMKSRI